MPSTLWLTTLAMLAFAGNSLLARLALSAENGGPAIDAAGFTGIRLAAGALVLGLIFLRRRRDEEAETAGPQTTCSVTPTQGRSVPSVAHAVAFETVDARETLGDHLPGSWTSAAALLVYAVCFSFAYLRIGAAIGALVLFAAVQATMIGAGLAAGERPRRLEILGLFVAFGAFVWWIAPHLVTPEIVGAVLMIVSGVAWGVYSLRGRGVGRPASVSAGNFIRTLPIAIPLILVSLAFSPLASFEGVLIALASGAGASGLGYIVWYTALPLLTATRAAIVQLSVPILAAGGGVLFLGESLNSRFIIAAVLVLGGIAFAVSVQAKPRQAAATSPATEPTP